jgi:hypothetical protein
MQNSFRQIARKVLPTVVEINVTELITQQVPQFNFPFPFFGQEQGNGGKQTFKQSGLGSGIIVRRSGDTYYVLTNNHVVDGATDISVRLYDQRVFRAKVTMVSGRAGDAMMLEHSSQITRFQRRRYCRRAERYMCWSGWRRRCACAATIIPMIPKAILLSSESDASPVSVAACENTIPAKNPPAPVTPANCTSVVVRLVSEVRPTIIKPLATANHFRPAKSFRSNPDAKVPTARQRNAKARNRPLPVLDPPSFTA